MSAQAEEQMCFEIKTILLAGHETSAAMLTWSLMELTKNPDALEKVKFCLSCHCLAAWAKQESDPDRWDTPPSQFVCLHYSRPSCRQL